MIVKIVDHQHDLNIYTNFNTYKCHQRGETAMSPLSIDVIDIYLAMCNCSIC